MRRNRIREVIVETEEVLIVQKRTAIVRRWCDGCGALVEMMTPEDAARRARKRTRVIYRLVEAGAVHFTESPAALLLVCLNSLNAETLY